jgi:DNA-binding NtrC family response regulator
MALPVPIAVDFGEAVIAQDPAMVRVLQTARSLAAYNAAVLITGETGSGKEVVAQTIHRFSSRSSRPWIDVNCAALPEHLVESELFGHEKGAFSGADSAKPGLFEMANGGTLFLDEIGEIDPRIQVKLLRVLDSTPFYRLGGTRKVSVDTRLIAATNRDLEAAVETGTFRRDLYHRITESQICVPPLRQRPRDIAALAVHFLKQLNPGKSLRSDALDLLMAMEWPGNVRELRNIVTKLDIEVSQSSIGADDIRRVGIGQPSHAVPVAEVPHSEASTAVEIERMMIVRALEATGGNQSRAALQLGIPRRTFCRKLEEYKINHGRRRDAALLELASRRVEIRVPLSVATNRGESFIAETTDISAGGLGLRSPIHPLTVSEEVRLRFVLPGCEAPLEATASIAWFRPDGTAGAQFTRVRAGHRDALRRWLSGNAESPLVQACERVPSQIPA